MNSVEITATVLNLTRTQNCFFRVSIAPSDLDDVSYYRQHKVAMIT